MGPSQTDLFGDSGAAPGSPSVLSVSQPDGGRPDADARHRIVTDLESNLLVEAGAGAGKTTEMVNRMVALVGAGSPVERIAAVTFTRKAAAELRERFQTRLEQELRAIRQREDQAAMQVVDRALREIDRAFIGTIHAFCARLLRERPLEAGVDPSFRETFAIEQDRMRRAFYAQYVERLAAAGDSGLGELARAGLSPDQLRQLFDRLTEYGDVDFPAVDIKRPDPTEARDELESLLDHALGLMPQREPDNGWDNLQSTIRRLRFYRDVVGWQEDIRFLHVLAENLAALPRASVVRWRMDGASKAEVSELVSRFRDYAGPDGTGGRVLRQWWAHRYPIVLSFAKAAAEAFAAERLRTGALSFQDLLMCTARLLRANPAARADLGERYRHILVDEFQDTDPLQAEILFLLASPPVPDARQSDWRTGEPRTGALFVVGDPKQSIYRFRRADITIYNQVKRRFDEIGAVVSLTANFRSGPPIEKLVDSVFAERFPATATEQQAAFAPLVVQQPAGPEQGVYSYRLVKMGDRPRREDLVDQDARRVASWIHARITDAGHVPADFLVLTRTKKHLAAYAREIEARNLPVQVTGGGISIEQELSELRLLLSALADPGDPRYTVATLTGLFFGLDHEHLAQHVLDAGGRLDFTEPPAGEKTPVVTALARLHRFWLMARTEPADVLVTMLVDELGLLPFAAAGELGESRAGALLFVLEAVRAAALQGDASLRGAIAAIDAAVATEDAEAPLEPGRGDAVRIMNVHQAKGLEANVVILASPFGDWRPAPTLHVRRGDAGVEGRIVVAERRWRFNDTVLARPLDWPEHEAAERAFDDAERDRLLYVAATRAKQQLLISRCPDTGDSPWSAFEPHLADFPILELPVQPQPPRETLKVTADEVRDLVAGTDARRAALAAPSWHAAAVRTRVKPPDSTWDENGGPAGPGTEDPPPETGSRAARPGPAAALPAGEQTGGPDPPGGLTGYADEGGMAWGRLVHQALEAVGRGLQADEVRAYCRTVLLAAEDPRIDVDTGEPLDLDALADVVTAVTRSDLWRRARAGRPMLVEVPFSITVPAAEYASLACQDAVGSAPGPDSAALEVIDGVIDLVFREDEGWVVVDYKSDREGNSVPSEIRDAYRRQVELYAECWTRLTGEPVRERIVFFTADGAAVPS